MQYFELKVPMGDGRCSYNDCPCGYPEAIISHGEGYMYITQEIVNFRQDAKTLKELDKKIKRIESSYRKLNASVTFTQAAITSIMMCEKGAKKLGIDLALASEDAKYWWKTGLVPLRATPIVPKNDYEFAEDIIEDIRNNSITDFPFYIALYGDRPLSGKSGGDESLMIFSGEETANQFIEGYKTFYKTLETLSILRLTSFEDIWTLLHLPSGQHEEYIPPFGLIVDFDYGTGLAQNMLSIEEIKDWGLEGVSDELQTTIDELSETEESIEDFKETDADNAIAVEQLSYGGSKPDEILDSNISGTAVKKEAHKSRCKKCNKFREKKLITCPHCGDTKWSTIYWGLFFGLIFMLFGNAVGMGGGPVFLAIILGLFGAIIVLGSILLIRDAKKIRKSIKN